MFAGDDLYRSTQKIDGASAVVRGVTFVSLTILVGFTPAVPATASLFPHYSVDKMCHMAEVIVEGTYVGTGRVQIQRLYTGSPPVPKESAIIEVPALEQHTLEIGERFTPGPGRLLVTRQVVLFLKSVNDKWTPLATIGHGSCGVIWYDEEACYRYFQFVNPGPYGLKKSDANHPSPDVPGSIAQVRQEIAEGLANAREWRRTLAIADKSAKAEALARYLLPSTSPKGDKGTHRYSVLTELRPLGRDAVPALIQVLRNAPENENVDTVVFTLKAIGPPAAAALPELIALLTQPKRASKDLVLCALRATDDPRAEAYLAPKTTRNDELIAKHEKYLEMLRKQQATAKPENGRGVESGSRAGSPAHRLARGVPVQSPGYRAF